MLAASASNCRRQLRHERVQLRIQAIDLPQVRGHHVTRGYLARPNQRAQLTTARKQRSVAWVAAAWDRSCAMVLLWVPNPIVVITYRDSRAGPRSACRSS